MQVTAYEGIIENGQIRLDDNVDLPEKTRVYVIVPGFEAPKAVHVYSPRLAHPEQVVDFKKEMIEDSSNAGI